MSTHALDNQMHERLVNEVAELKRQLREFRTLQTQGDTSLQIGYTPDSVVSTTVTVTPGPDGVYGIIGTYLCVLQYVNPRDDSVVFADLDIGVNEINDVFDGTYNLSAYYGGLRVEIVNDMRLEKLYYDQIGHHAAVKVVRLFTPAPSVSRTYYIHTRWRYLGVGKTLSPVLSDTIIIPSGPILT